MWIVDTPLGAFSVRVWEAWENTSKKGKDGVLTAQYYWAHLKHIFLSQPAKGSLQLNREKRHSQANTHQSQ